MKSSDRRNKINDLLNIHGSMQVSQLAEILNVSMETIRRDLDILCEQYEIKKIHGGAVKNSSSSNEYFFNKRLNHNLSEKQEIAKIASEFIEDGDIIALDTGTTVLQLIDYIYNKDISIVTSSLPVLTTLSKYNISRLKGKIIFLGGEFNENSLSIYGEISMSMLKSINISKAFVSCDSFKEEEGIFFHNVREGVLTSEFIKRAEKSYLLLDSSKLSKNSFYNIGPISSVDTIISSAPCPDDLKSLYPNTDWVYIYNK